VALLRKFSPYDWRAFGFGDVTYEGRFTVHARVVQLPRNRRGLFACFSQIIGFLGRLAPSFLHPTSELSKIVTTLCGRIEEWRYSSTHTSPSGSLSPEEWIMSTKLDDQQVESSYCGLASFPCGPSQGLFIILSEGPYI
jgi:hypothetical protein